MARQKLEMIDFYPEGGRMYPTNTYVSIVDGPVRYAWNVKRDTLHRVIGWDHINYRASAVRDESKRGVVDRFFLRDMSMSEEAKRLMDEALRKFFLGEN